MLLGAAMLASAAPEATVMPVMAESAAAAVDDNFENYADKNEMLANYEVENSGNLVLERQTEENRALWFRQTSGSTINLKKTWQAMTGGFVVISTSFHQSMITETRLQQVWSYGENKRPYVLFTYKENDLRGNISLSYGENGETKSVKICEYAANKWYKISTVLDISKKLVYVFVDGQLINPSGFGFYQDATAVDGMNIQTNNSDAKGRMFLDNIYADCFKSFEAAAAAVSAHAIANDIPGTALSAAKKSGFAQNTAGCLATLRTQDSAEALAELNSYIDSAIPSATKVLFNADFWKLSAGQSPSNASSYKALSGCVMVSENGEMYAKLTNTGSRARILKELSTAETAENMAVTFSFMQKTKSAIDAVARATDVNGSMQSAYAITSDGTSLYLTGGNNSQVEIVENYLADHPYDIKVDIDYLNQSVSCCVDSQYAGSVPFGADYKGAKAAVARVFDSFNNNRGEYYIGNIVVTSDNLESPDCYISGILFRDAEGNEYSKPVVGGTFEKAYAVKNNSDGKTVVYNAVYSGGSLIGVTSRDISGEPEGQNIEMDVNIRLPESDDILVKQFIWDGTTSPKASNTVRSAGADGTTVYIVGDSTVATYDYATYYPQTGWGQMLENYLNGATVKNFAIPGSSLKQMYKQGVFDNVIAQGRPGDFLLIQFGHNDSKITYAEYSDIFAGYRAYLKYYAERARAKGMIPIFVTSPVRRRNNIFGGESSLVSYAAAVKSVGRALNIPVIDLFTKSSELVSCLDSEEADSSKKLFLFVDANDSRYFGDGSAYTSSVYNKDGKTEDNTHFCAYGADVLAGIVAEGIENCGYEIASRVDEVKHIPTEQ